MDLQKIITDLLGKIQNDKDLIANFKKDPIATVTKLVKSLNLSANDIKTIADAIGVKLKVDDAKGMLDAIGGLFGKK